MKIPSPVGDDLQRQVTHLTGDRNSRNTSTVKNILKPPPTSKTGKGTINMVQVLSERNNNNNNNKLL